MLWNNWKATGAKVEQFFKKKNANIAISLSTQQCYKKEYGKEVPIVYNGVEILNQKTYKNHSCMHNKPYSLLSGS